ncbi:MAG: 50S ribosomal protein L9 [Thermodesulfobacteriota bacterium]|nr:MAG: 50S ribosomal protein L9 [Thermodesulfobacteriota bacterium]
MEVILKSDSTDLGRYGDVVNVKMGYARNYLIPRGFAVEAKPGNMKQFNAEKDAYLKKMEAKKAEAGKLSAEIEGLTLTFERKTGDEEKLFGSVTANDIEKEIKARGYKDIERRDILLAEPIKKLGEYDVPIRLHPDVSVTIKVEVTKG